MDTSSLTHYNLILPLREDQVSDFLSDNFGAAGDDLLASLSRPAVASLYLLGKARLLAEKPDKAPEIMRSQLAAILDETRDLPVYKAFRDHVRKTLSSAALKDGLRVIAVLGIGLQKPSELDAPQPTNANGTWNPEFSVELVNRRLGRVPRSDRPDVRATGLNDPQYRIFTVAQQDPDDHLHIHGFGGVGKTRLIREVYATLPGKHTAILAQTRGQLQALASGFTVSPNTITFPDLAIAHLRQAGVSQRLLERNRIHGYHNVTDKTIAWHMGFEMVGSLRPDEVAGKVVRGIIFKFCDSTDTKVTHTHLTKDLGRLSGPERDRFVRYAQQYWDEMVNESSSKWQPLRSYHLIKWASLTPREGRLQVSVGRGGDNRIVDLGFVIVDEAHDLTPAMTKLIYDAGVAVFSLSDTFQRISGVPPAIPVATRSKELNLSMRAGPELGDAVNPLLEVHPRWRQGMGTLEGVKDATTRIHFYSVRRIPNTPYTILCGSLFSVFEYVHQLVNSGATLALLPATHRGLVAFVDSLFLLRRGHRGQHPLLFRYATWDQMAEVFKGWSVFQKVDRLFCKTGYSENDFRNVLARVGDLGSTDYIIGLVDHSKNWQFPNVMVSPELFSQQKTDRFVADNLSRVYLAMTRAQHNLAIPEGVDGFLDSVRRVSGGGASIN